MPLVLAGATSGQATVQATDAATVTLTLPASSGTLVVTGGAQTIEFADGSAAAPSITNSGDTNTGIFFPAADTIAFTEGGVESMRIDSSGNVGIGTSSPAYALDVRSTTAPAIRLSRSGTAGQIASMVFEDGNATLGSGSTTRVASDAGAMSFSTGGTSGAVTGGTERMRIDSSGFLCLNRTSALGNAYINIDYSSTGQYGILIKNTSTTFNGAFLEFRNSAGNTAGNIIQNGTTTVSFTTSSDYRLKENIAPMTGALAKVAQLKPVTYKWKVDGSSGQGFIAHELQEVVPDCVTGEKDGMRTEQYEVSPAIPATYDEEGNELTPAVEAVMGEREVPAYQGIDTSFLVATLTAAIQEQQTIITDLKARIETLENT